MEFNQVAIETAEGSEDMINRVMTKDNIGLAALLRTKDNAWENGGLLFQACSWLSWDLDGSVDLVILSVHLDELDYFYVDGHHRFEIKLKGISASELISFQPCGAMILDLWKPLLPASCVDCMWSTLAECMLVLIPKSSFDSVAFSSELFSHF